MCRYFKNEYLARVFKDLMEGYGYTVTMHYLENEWCVEYSMEEQT
jgi:hypothetical protein